MTLWTITYYISTLDYCISTALVRHPVIGFTIQPSRGTRSRPIEAQRVSDMEFAEDLALLADSTEQLGTLLKELETVCGQIGLRFNLDYGHVHAQIVVTFVTLAQRAGVAGERKQSVTTVSCFQTTPQPIELEKPFQNIALTLFLKYRVAQSDKQIVGRSPQTGRVRKKIDSQIILGLFGIEIWSCFGVHSKFIRAKNEFFPCPGGCPHVC
eukprot:sb/3470178/